MTRKDKITLILAGLCLLIIVGAVIVGRKKKAAKLKRFNEIMDRINKGVGESGQDVKSLLYKVKPDMSYNPAADFKKLVDADKGVLTDDHSAIFAVIKGKTKAKLARLDQYMQQKGGRGLDKYLIDTLKEVGDRTATDWLNGTYTRYQMALNIINAA
jgi:tartrate dehydratase alpha subunit/fumarate hydratase class I-like protein